MASSTFPSAPLDRPNPASALTALILLVPVPSIGTLFAMHLPTEGSFLGQSLFFLSKVWIIALPVVWWKLVDRKPFSVSPARHGGFGVAISLGLLISVVVYVAYRWIGPQLIDAETVRAQAAEAGIGRPLTYLAFAVYLCTVNAVVEEYVWRWFVVRQSEALLPRRRWLAVPISAALFTVHHVIALRAQFSWPVTAIGSAGVFVGGVVWSWCYYRYRSIWPGFVSHLIVDVTILAIGWQLIFGG